MKYKFVDQEIELSSSPDGLLYWPTDWTEELTEHGFLEAAASILVAMPKCAVQTPWIIGSASKSLTGQTRLDSESHMSGKAFDMSPMYSDTEILSPEGRIMGLAWNVVSVDIVARAYKEFPHFVVEGDHLHVQPESEMPRDKMLCAFTMPSWYPWVGTLLSDEAESKLENTFWTWHLGRYDLCISSNEEVDAFIAALRHQL